jgi:hypothetical protein
VVEHQCAHDSVERCVVDEVQRLLRVVHAQFGPVTQSLPRVTQQSCAAVDSDYLGTTRQEFGRVVPGPAADIENLQPGNIPR